MTSHKTGRVHRFWKVLAEQNGSLPGQEKWKSANVTQWTSILNRHGDRVGIYIAKNNALWIFVTGSKSEQGENRVPRMNHYSQKIRAEFRGQELGNWQKSIDGMSEQSIKKLIERESRSGRSIKIRRHWLGHDEGDWPNVASWIGAQFEKLKRIITAGT